jgi:glucan phosphoethanolaminetransferase (alkaline phosphatase superfamily)
MISRDANIIKRHRNPVGIFSRMLIYPLIGLGAWRHRLDLVAAGAALEALLWTAVSPAEETFGFVEDAIETELGWLNAPSGPQKTLSFVLLALFPVAVFAGLWRRSWRLLAASAALIAIFYLLMLSVAAKSWAN